MSLTPSNPPPAPSSGPPPGLRSLPIDLGDLLLVLIINLLALRFLPPLIEGIVIPQSPVDQLDPSRFLYSLLFVFIGQSLILLGAIDWVIRRKYDLTWADLGLRPMGPGWMQRSIIFGVLSVPLMTIFLLVTQEFLPESPENPQMEIFQQLPPTWFSAISVIAVTAVLVPIAEELAFRGILFPWLRDRYNLSAGIFISGLLFAAVHGMPAYIPAFTVFGMFLAAIAHHSGSLWPPIIVHGIFNAIQLSLIFKFLMAGVLPGQA
ncbi:MAG: type II CAAX endopeptidase family protein [Pseudomonadota bacterium]